MKKINMLFRESLVSTNDWLSENIESIELPSVIHTNFQSGGKGQGGKKWDSEKGKNILASIIMPVQNLRADQNFFISKITALSVLESLNEYLDEAVIKWPNDILFNGMKIAGILIENKLSADQVVQTIIGMGININQTEFPKMDIEPTSLKRITSKETDLDEFLNSLLMTFLEYFELLDRNEFDLIDKYYFSHLLNFNIWAEYKFEDVPFKGIIRDVMDDGYLIMETSDGKFRKYGFGEISYVLE